MRKIVAGITPFRRRGIILPEGEFAKIDFEAWKCRKNFKGEAGKVFIPPDSEQPTCEKEIQHPLCGVRTLEEIWHSESGQAQLAEEWMRLTRFYTTGGIDYIRSVEERQGRIRLAFNITLERKEDDIMLKTIYRKPFFHCILVHGLFPSLFYFIMFCLLTYPLITMFSTHFFGDFKDVLQNVWNIWWINKAVLNPNLYPTIWQTNMLHWPYGTTLIGQTLNPFNGYMAVFLLRFLSLIETHNAIIIFTFVVGGLTTYWLSRYLTRSFGGSILAGFIFTFSSYSFAHARAHMNLVSLEWIPLFILCWYLLITRPKTIIAVGAAVVLWMVILCDYSYFLFCVLTAIWIVVWYAIVQKKAIFFIGKDYIVPLITFVVLALLLIGPIISTLAISNLKDPLLGSHEPRNYSLDPLSLIIPGWGWIFNSLTKFHWSTLNANIVESTVYIGLSVYILMGYVFIKRRELERPIRDQVYLWHLVMGFFFLLALGPALQIAGKVIWDKVMPYTLFVDGIPILKLSGLPVRMSVMIILGAALIAAIGFQELLKNFPKNRVFILALLGILFIETVPTTINGTKVEVPEYIAILAGLPNDGGVVDLVTDNARLSSYYQTSHKKPLAFGFLARIPSSVDEKDKELLATIQNRDYCTLWDTYHIRYLITNDVIQTEDVPPYISIEIVYDKDNIRIYRIGCECE
jgi:hypothetical protein